MALVTIPLGSSLTLELLDELRVSQSALERNRRPSGADGDVVPVAPEDDLVAGFDAERVAEVLGDHDLALGTDLVSHTSKYDRCFVERQLCAESARRSPTRQPR